MVMRAPRASQSSTLPAPSEPQAAVVQLKQSLRGLPFEAQTAALAPDGASSTHEAARQGTAGAGQKLPHLEAIQRSFGRHQVGDVQAHVGGKASEASNQIGAEAYAFGNDVAFAKSPDLHTAAHEAAHAVHQRGGISLYGGVGQEGDAYEANADAVADAVVAGRSAEPLLDRFARGGGGGGGRAQVQRKPKQPESKDRQIAYTPESTLKVNVGKVLNMRNEWYDAAISLLQKALDNPLRQLDSKQRLDAERLMFALTQQKEVRRDEDQTRAIIEPGDLQRLFDDTMPGRLTVMVSHTLGLPEDGMVQQMREAYIRMKNSQPWTTIQKQIDMRKDGGVGTQQVTSTITPVNQSFDDTYHGTHGVEGKRFGQTGLGSMSPRLEAGGRDHQKETHRPTNLWHSKLEDDQGKLLFEAFRSGAFSDVAIKDPGQQAQVGQAKAKQVLEAMLIHRLKQISNPQELWAILQGQQTYTASVVSINLLTEAKALGFGDKTAAEQHHAAIQAVSGQELTYDIKMRLPWDPTQTLWPFQPKANFRVLDFGTGVNIASGMLGFGGATINQKKRNKESMKMLVEDYQTWRVTTEQKLEELQNGQDLEGGDGREAEIKKLGDDLRQAQMLLAEIKKKGMGHVGDYKLPQLLANLAHLMGHLVHFNCKSGKDRTGIMDAKSKHLAYELHAQRQQGGDDMEMPRLSRRDDDEEVRHQQMLWESGNLQVLEQNVGGQSLKVADLAKVPIRNKDSRLRTDLGGESGLKELQGLKRYTNIDHGMKPGKRGLTGKPKQSSAKKERTRALQEMNNMLSQTHYAFTLAKHLEQD